MKKIQWKNIKYLKEKVWCVVVVKCVSAEKDGILKKNHIHSSWEAALQNTF